MSQNFITSLVCVLGVASLSISSASDSVLRPTGKPVTIDQISKRSIVIPENATAQDRYSASLLAEYLENIYGAKLPIVQEPKQVSGRVISVGPTKLAESRKIVGNPREQSYLLAEDRGDLFILGGTRGPIYGVIALLEEDLGCRLYTSGMKPIIPKTSEDKLSFVPRSYAPPFEVREILAFDAMGADFNTFNRLQPISYHTLLPFENGGGFTNPKFFIHTYAEMISADEYYAEHPEYFPLRDGKRISSTIRDGQLCYTNPDVIRIMAEKIEKAIEAEPSSLVYSVSSNDNVHDNCECESCQEIIKVDGISGIQLNLANEVASKLSGKYPNIKITTLAYVNSQKPPKNIKPGPNTVMFYAPIRPRGENVLLPISDIKAIDEELQGWHKVTKNIYLWDYVDTIGDVAIPFPSFDAQNDWKYLIENGVMGVFLEACVKGRNSLSELKSWVYAKNMWNPDLPLDPLIQEFVKGYYGKAAPEMQKYVDFQRKQWRAFFENRKPKQSFRFSKQDIQDMRGILDAALAKSSDDPELRDRLEREYLTFLCLPLSRNPKIEDREEYQRDLQQAEKLTEQLNVGWFSDSAESSTYLSQWNDKLKRLTDGGSIPQMSKNSVVVKRPLVFGDTAISSDADASLGESVRLGGGAKRDWTIQWQFNEFIDLLDEGKPYVVRARLRPEFKNPPGKDGELFSIGSYIYGVTGVTSLKGQYDSQDKEGYKWVTLGKIQIDTPSASGVLFACPGSILDEDDAVWVDYIEFVPLDEFKDKNEVKDLPIIVI